MIKKMYKCWILILISLFPLTACGLDSEAFTKSDGLKVVATTTIVGDVVSQVGGDLVSLEVLLPVGTDPHSFDPTPKDVARVAEADVVFINGGGLEAFLDTLIESAGAEDLVVNVSEGIDFLETGDSHDEGDSGQVEHGAVDPHTWTDPNNVMVWVKNIQGKLAELDPANAVTYEANAVNYLAELKSLDAWIREQVAQIPESNRKFLADHGLYGYYANTYGFEQIGTLLPGYSTLAEPSAQELAKTEDLIATSNVKAILMGNTANPSLAERVSADTGTQLVFVYTGSLSKSDGEAGSYIAYMQYNTTAIVSALK